MTKRKSDESQKMMSSEIQKLTNERQNILSEVENSQRDLAEIKKKYTEKSREYDRLKDLYNNVRTKATSNDSSSNLGSPIVDTVCNYLNIYLTTLYLSTKRKREAIL